MWQINWQGKCILLNDTRYEALKPEGDEEDNEEVSPCQFKDRSCGENTSATLEKKKSG